MDPFLVRPIFRNMKIPKIMIHLCVRLDLVSYSINVSRLFWFHGKLASCWCSSFFEKDVKKTVKRRLHMSVWMETSSEVLWFNWIVRQKSKVVRLKKCPTVALWHVHYENHQTWKTRLIISGKQKMNLILFSIFRCGSIYRFGVLKAVQ